MCEAVIGSLNLNGKQCASMCTWLLECGRGQSEEAYSASITTKVHHQQLSNGRPHTHLLLMPIYGNLQMCVSVFYVTLRLESGTNLEASTGHSISRLFPTNVILVNTNVIPLTYLNYHFLRKPLKLL